MYTTTPVKDKEKHSSKDKDKYMKSANYFQTP